jgi:membrane-associated protein
MSGETLLAFLLGFKYLALFILVIVEGFFATIAGGALSAQGVFNLIAVMIVVVTADMASDFLYFTFGKKISKTRFAKFLSLSATQIHRVERLFAKHGPNTIIVAKLSSYLAVPVIVGAGAIHMPKRIFYSYCVVAAFLKATVLVMLGYYFGKEIHHLVNIAIITSILISIAALSYTVGSHYLQIKDKK